MPTVEERVAYLEGRLEDHAGVVGAIQQDLRDLRNQIENLDQRVDRLFHDLDSKVDGLFHGLDSKIDGHAHGLDSKVHDLDSKVDRLFHGLDSKVSRQFIWIAGIQMAVLLAVVGVLSRQ